MITIKLANGKEVSSESGEEIYWFNQSEGRSIVKPLVKVEQKVEEPKQSK